MLSFCPTSDTPISSPVEFTGGGQVMLDVAINNSTDQSVSICALRAMVLDLLQSSIFGTALNVDREISLDSVVSTTGCDVQSVDVARVFNVSVGSVTEITISLSRDVDLDKTINSELLLAQRVAVQRSIESNVNNWSDVQIVLGGIRCFGSSIESTMTISMPGITFNRVFSAAVESESDIGYDLSVDRGIGLTVGAVSDFIASLLSGDDYGFERVYISSPTVSAILLTSKVDDRETVTTATTETVELVSSITTSIMLTSKPVGIVNI